MFKILISGAFSYNTVLLSQIISRIILNLDVTPIISNDLLWRLFSIAIILIRIGVIKVVSPVSFCPVQWCDSCQFMRYIRIPNSFTYSTFINCIALYSIFYMSIVCRNAFIYCIFDSVFSIQNNRKIF